MKRTIALVALGLSLSAGVAFSAEGTCLHYRDLDGLKKVDRETLIATKKGGGHYKISLDSKCDYLNWPDNFFVTRNKSPWECVNPGDALILHRGGACSVQSVTPVSD